MVRVKGVYKQRGSRFYWFRHAINGKRLAVSLKTDDLGEALKRAEVIKATGLVGAVPTDLEVSDSFRRRLEGEIDKTPAILEVERYEAESQNRERNPVNKFVARDRTTVLKKFLSDTNISHPAQLNGQKILRWIKDLRVTGKSTETTAAIWPRSRDSSLLKSSPEGFSGTIRWTALTCPPLNLRDENPLCQRPLRTD